VVSTIKGVWACILAHSDTPCTHHCPPLIVISVKCEPYGMTFPLMTHSILPVMPTWCVTWCVDRTRVDKGIDWYGGRISRRLAGAAYYSPVLYGVPALCPGAQCPPSSPSGEWATLAHRQPWSGGRILMPLAGLEALRLEPGERVRLYERPYGRGEGRGGYYCYYCYYCYSCYYCYCY
jgi:hypothetical protein